MPRLRNNEHEAFARHYVHLHNAAKAGAMVGYSKSTADALISRYPTVAARVAELTDMLLKKTDITAERVMLELGRVAFSDLRKIVDDDGRLLPLKDLDADTAAAIAGIEVESRTEVVKGLDLATGEPVTRMTPVVTTKIKRSDKVAALNILAKHFKLVGDEGDGVNALASALADRLQSARRRVIDSTERIEDARLIEDNPAAVQPREGTSVPQHSDGHRPDTDGEPGHGLA
jgi:phage terminase small subunit